MNKLKKISRAPSTPEKPLGQPSSSPPKSNPARTSSGGTPIQSSAIISTSSRPSTIGSLRPQSTVEQYWAARALKAETLLSARTAHHRELKALASSEAIKRTEEVSALTRKHEAKLKKMEWVMLAMALCLASLLFGTGCLITSLYRHKPHTSSRTFPSHFTIPILSPFTSVVENETSTIATRSIVAFTAIMATLAYFVFRHWLVKSRIIR